MERSRLVSLAALVLGMLAPGGLSGQDKAVASALSLSDARASMSAASAGPDFALRLGKLADALPATVSLALIMEFAPKAPMADRAGLFRRAADTALLLGDFATASEGYAACASESSGGRTELLLKAARCQLAAGELGKARDLVAQAQTPAAGRGALVNAWALLLEGRRAEARAMATEIESGSSGSEKREARLIEWAASDSEERAGISGLLATESPGSPEALIASGAIAPMPLPHWYLGGLAAQTRPPAMPAPEAAPASPAAQAARPPVQAKPPSASGAASGASKVLRFQVGYFAKEENAVRLKTELAGKGIAARIDEKDSGEGQRWTVMVDAGPDPQRTSLRLKDAGYESYPQF